MTDSQSLSRTAIVRPPRRDAVVVACIGALWLLLRAPNLITAPRFWAEEASFVSAASRYGFLESLIHVYPRAGYYSWPVNLGATLGVDLLPLHLAPIATTLLAGLLQLSPLWATMTLPFETPVSRVQRAVLAIALLVATTSGQGSVWLNALSSQAHLGILAAVVLVCRARQHSELASWSLVAVLFLAGLSGVYAVFLLPAFWMTTLSQRERWRMRQCLALSVAGCIQVLVHLYVRYGLDRVNPKRGAQPLTFENAIVGIRESIAFPLLGQDAVTRRMTEIDLPLVIAGTIFGISIAVLIRGLASERQRRFTRTAEWLGAEESRVLLAWVSVVLFVCVFSYSGSPAGRYAVVPGALTILIVAIAARRANARGLRWILSSVLAWCIWTGTLDPRDPEAVACDGNTSGWREAAARPRGNEPTILPICPEGWEVKVYSVEKTYDG